MARIRVRFDERSSAGNNHRDCNEPSKPDRLLKSPTTKSRARTSVTANRKVSLKTSPLGKGLSRSRKSNSQSKVREDLAIELYALARLGLHRFGLTPAEQRRALKRSLRLKAAPRVSGPLLRDARSLSALLLEWSRSPQYVDAKGRPRVLSIKGQGDTFQSLARQFLPAMPLADVIAMSCATTEVSTLPKGRIALVGGTTVNVARSNTPPLAHAVRQIDQLLETTLHNAKLKPHQQAHGRMQRLVIGVISRAEYEDLMRELRPQIADLLERIDSFIEQHRPRNAKTLKSAVAVSVGVYVSVENDWERAGVDVSALLGGKRP